MASNKNQHYVPKCYLKPFTRQTAGRAIDLFNLDRRQLIVNAPVKNQCSRDYFYGKDADLERMIRESEGAYSTVRNAILTAGYLLTDQHRSLLSSFWLMQHLRTEEASRRIVEMANQAEGFFGAGDGRLRMVVRDAVLMAMNIYLESQSTVSDLKVCLLRNRSGIPFVTSDHPAVLANRLHQQNPRIRDRPFSLVSAGALLVLPLSPEVLCLAYDGDVYSIQHVNGWVSVRRDADVNALNQHQYLNAQANIFLGGEAHADYVAKAVNEVWERRPAAIHKMTFMVADERSATIERYREVSREEAEAHDEALVQWQQVRPEPKAWPQQIGFRQGARAFSNGSAVGWVRRAQIRVPTSRPFKKIKIK